MKLTDGVFGLLQTKKLTNQSRSSYDGRLFFTLSDLVTRSSFIHPLNSRKNPFFELVVNHRVPQSCAIVQNDNWFLCF